MYGLWEMPSTNMGTSPYQQAMYNWREIMGKLLNAALSQGPAIQPVSGGPAIQPVSGGPAIQPSSTPAGNAGEPMKMSGMIEDGALPEGTTGITYSPFDTDVQKGQLSIQFGDTDAYGDKGYNVFHPQDRTITSGGNFKRYYEGDNYANLSPFKVQ